MSMLRSKSMVRLMSLTLPPCKERKHMVQKAWLELPGGLGTSDILPVTVKMSGLSLEDETRSTKVSRWSEFSNAGWPRSGEILATVYEGTNAGPEEEEEDETVDRRFGEEERVEKESSNDDNSDTSFEWDSKTNNTTILAEDSVSHCSSVDLSPVRRRASSSSGKGSKGSSNTP